MAELCGVTPAAISRYASGENEPGIRVAVSIARALGVTVETLLGDEVADAPSALTGNLKPIAPYKPAGGEPLSAAETPPIYAPDYLDERLARLVALLEWVYTRGDQRRRQALRGALEEMVDEIKRKPKA